jgi:hypothetical protein
MLIPITRVMTSPDGLIVVDGGRAVAGWLGFGTPLAIPGTEASAGAAASTGTAVIDPMSAVIGASGIASEGAVAVTATGPRAIAGSTGSTGSVDRQHARTITSGEATAR